MAQHDNEDALVVAAQGAAGREPVASRCEDLGDLRETAEYRDLRRRISEYGPDGLTQTARLEGQYASAFLDAVAETMLSNAIERERHYAARRAVWGWIIAGTLILAAGIGGAVAGASHDGLVSAVRDYPAKVETANDLYADHSGLPTETYRYLHEVMRENAAKVRECLGDSGGDSIRCEIVLPPSGWWPR